MLDLNGFGVVFLWMYWLFLVIVGCFVNIAAFASDGSLVYNEARAIDLKGAVSYSTPKNTDMVPDYKDYIKSARAFCSDKKYEDCIAAYRRAASINPQQEVYNGLVSVYLSLGKYNDAVSCYIDLMRLDTLIQTKYLKDSIDIIQNNASVDFTKELDGMVDIFKDRPFEMGMIGSLEVFLGKYDLAVQHLNVAILKNPNNVGFLYNRAISYDKLNQLEKAYAAYGDVLKVYELQIRSADSKTALVAINTDTIRKRIEYLNSVLYKH